MITKFVTDDLDSILECSFFHRNTVLSLTVEVHNPRTYDLNDRWIDRLTWVLKNIGEKETVREG